MQSEKRGKDEASVAIDGSTQLVQAGLTAPAAIAKQAKSANSAKSVSSLWVLLMTNLQGFADHGVLACQIVTGHKPKYAPVDGQNNDHGVKITLCHTRGTSLKHTAHR